MLQDWEFLWVDLSVYLGNEREVHARQKIDSWWFLGITFATIDLEAVNAILVHGL